MTKNEERIRELKQMISLMNTLQPNTDLGIIRLVEKQQELIDELMHLEAQEG